MEHVNPEIDNQIFQQIDLDFYEGPPLNDAENSTARVPIFRVYGVNDSGNSILAHLYGYVPYLYSSSPVGVKPTDLHRFTEALNKAAKNENRAKEQPDKAVLDIRLETKENIYGFHG